MFNPAKPDSAFVEHLRNTHSTNNLETTAAHINVRQWLEYWNDAESVTTNLRKFEYWLQRANIQN